MGILFSALGLVYFKPVLGKLKESLGTETSLSKFLRAIGILVIIMLVFPMLLSGVSGQRTVLSEVHGLASLQDNSDVFIRVFGETKREASYTFYRIQSDGGHVLDTVNAGWATIYYFPPGTDEPRVEIWVAENFKVCGRPEDTYFAKLGLLECTDSDGTTTGPISGSEQYKFFVPEGTVLNVFELDGQ